MQLHLNKLELHCFSWCGCHRVLSAPTMFKLSLKWADILLTVWYTWKYIFMTECWESIWVKNYQIYSVRSPSVMMYETRLGPKTHLGMYFGIHHNFCFAPLANRCGGLVVRESAPHAAGPGFESWCRCYHSHLMVQTTSPYEHDSRSV